MTSSMLLPMASAAADASKKAENLNTCSGGPKGGRFGNDLLEAPARKVVQAEHAGSSSDSGAQVGAASNGFVMLGEPPKPRAVRRSEPKPPPQPPPLSDNATNALPASPSTDLVVPLASAAADASARPRGSTDEARKPGGSAMICWKLQLGKWFRRSIRKVVTAALQAAAS